jgi:hypothetical protein
MAAQGRFPPLLLLRRYLKLAFRHCEGAGLLDTDATDVAGLPFDLDALPVTFPPPSELVLWVQVVPETAEETPA